MVSKRVVEKSFECHRHQKESCSSNFSAADAAPAGSIFASLNASIFTFHRRLLRYVSRLFRATNSNHRALFVVKRPGVNEFLKRISEKYKVVVFTAGLEDYASLVLDKLDKNHVISQRLYRDSCKEVNGKYVKDLSLVAGKDLGSVLIVDDNPFSYSLQPIRGYEGCSE